MVGRYVPKKRKTFKKEIFQEPKPKELFEVYSHKEIGEIFNIPKDSENAFIAFIESKEINQELFKIENEVKLIEYLIEQRKLFIEGENKD